VVLRTLEDGKARLRQEVRDPAVNATLGLSVTPMGPEGVVAIFSKLPEQAVSKSEVAYSPFWEYLSGRVAQEIKNPMVAINTFAQLLPKKYASEDFREGFFDVVQKEVVRINNVVETLFSFARQPELVLQRADVNATIDNVLRAFDDELHSRSIEVKREFDPQAAEADLDPVYFSQAVHNIVQNSIDAMPEGGVLKIETKRRESKVQVTVADTGPGIRQEDAPLVFMPFYSTKERGMGLGLSMAMRIAQDHDGDLKLEGSGEKGTSFTLSIPAEARSGHENDPGH
jgi:signal transduction histidine kinase